MSESDRDDSGRFTESVTEQDILKVFDRVEAPFLTASELASEVGLSRQAANYRLKRMQDDELVNSKRAGSRSVGWWAEVGPRLSPETRCIADAADRENSVSQDEMKRRLGMDG